MYTSDSASIFVPGVRCEKEEDQYCLPQLLGRCLGHITLV